MTRNIARPETLEDREGLEMPGARSERRRTTPRVEVPVNPNDGQHEIIALAGQSWARGADATEARKRLHTITGEPVRAYLIVPKGAWVDDIGRQILWRTEEAGDTHADGACALCRIG